MKIKINKQWNDERFTPALLQWKAGAAREKAKSIVLGLLKVQRECGKQGLKNLQGRQVVSVSSRMVSAWYRDYASQKKFIHWVEQFGIACKDRSWLNAILANDEGKQPYCDSWHITEGGHFKKGALVEVEFDDNFGLLGIYRSAIQKAEGMKVDDAHSFHGMWALKDYIEGRLSWGDFIEVGKAAHNCLKGSIKKGPSCRVFDAVSLCKKELRGKCFTDDEGNESKEVFDIPGAVTFTAPLAMAAFELSTFSDVDVFNWATDLAAGSSSDPYKNIWKRIHDIDPKTNAYGADRKWTKSIRKTVKMDLQCVANCNVEYLLEGKKAYHEFFGNHFIQQNKRRQWLLWNAIKKANKPLANAILATKAGGIQDAFYRLHTFGEKMVMNVLIKELKKMGIVVHRVHDAIWTSDKRLTNLTEKQMDALVGKIIIQFLKTVGRIPCGRKGIQKMVKEAGISRAEAEWVWEAIKGFKQLRKVA